MNTIKEIQDENAKGIHSLFNACMHKRECCEREAEIGRLRAALTALISGDVGRQTLAKLEGGQGTDTNDGRAWMHAAEMVTPNVKSNS